MCKKTFVAAFAIGAAALGSQTSAWAIEATQNDWAAMMSVQGMDKDRDGRLSKQEYLDVMARAYDKKAREMKADHRGIDALNLPPYLRDLVLNIH